jgi:hypothetical protein
VSLNRRAVVVGRSPAGVDQLRGVRNSFKAACGVEHDARVDRGYHPLVYRYLLLQAHYRTPVDFSWQAMDGARVGLRRLLNRYASERTSPAPVLSKAAQAHLDDFDVVVSDDLNTPKALAVLGAAARDASLSHDQLAALAHEFDAVLAIGLADLSAADLDLKRSQVTATDSDVDMLVAERTSARADRDFARSDDLRAQLADLGVTLQDHPDGHDLALDLTNPVGGDDRGRSDVPSNASPRRCGSPIRRKAIEGRTRQVEIRVGRQRGCRPPTTT